MGRAARDQILVDETTKQACEQYYNFAPAEMVTLKGKSGLVPIYEPGEQLHSSENANEHQNVVLDMGFGRDGCNTSATRSARSRASPTPTPPCARRAGPRARPSPRSRAACCASG